MSGFLAFLIFFGCLLICAQCGCITAAPDEQGRIVLFAGGPGIRHTEGLARMIQVNKLTREQVMLLEEEEFEASKDGEEEDACCAICLDEFEDGAKVRVLPCGHRFHEDCLVPWLTERHASCPLCKMDVLKHVQEIEKRNNKSKESDDKESSIETPVNSTEDNGSTATQGSSVPRSIWHYWMGWSLIANNVSQERPHDDASNSNSSRRTLVNDDESAIETELESSSRSLGLSEIEMRSGISSNV